MDKSQKGFSFVMVILVFVVVALIGFAGWHIQNTGSTINKVQPHSANPTPPASSEKTFEYSGSEVKITLYSTENPPPAYIRLKIPDGWIATQDSQGGLGFYADDLTYRPSIKFNYSSTADDRDINRFMLSETDADDVPKEYKKYQKSDYGLVNGNQATLYYHMFSKGESIGNIQMQGGEKELMYFIVKGKDAVMVSYYILVGDKDQTSLINSVIRSINF